MRDSAHWSAIDPLDLSADEWLTDPEKYRSWSCDLGAVPLAEAEAPPTGTAAAVFREQVAGLGSVAACEGLGARLNAERLGAAAAAAATAAAVRSPDGGGGGGGGRGGRGRGRAKEDTSRTG